MFTILTPDQIETKLSFIKEYMQPKNAADSSIVDPNANVSSKNVATMETEIHKDINIQINRALMQRKLKELYGSELAQQYVEDLKDHRIYVHDETSLKPYCASISMYPFLMHGMNQLGGESKAPKHLYSFCGSFVNMVFSVAAQHAGAIATVEFLTYFDYFARKDYGRNYLRTHTHTIENYLQHVVYTLNQPAAARGYQSVFWNISLFDENYFKSLFENFVFPDTGEAPDAGSVRELQEFFLNWFNKERSVSLLTYPVVTCAMLVDNTEPKDKDFAWMCAKNLSEGGSFFIYSSDKVDSLSSCCRLRNELADNTFSYTLGAGGVSTGSVKVITLNMNRIEQKGIDLSDQVKRVQKYLIGYRKIMEEYQEAGLLPAYTAGFISFKKQFLTIGINGLLEAASFRDVCAALPGGVDKMSEFVDQRLKVIYDLNKQAYSETGYRFNTEMVPAENLGVKNAAWDSKEGLKTYGECYNSYFYPVNSCSYNPIRKFMLHGKACTQYLDGGSALHLNLEESLDAEQYYTLMCIAAQCKCNYWCTNVLITICDRCGHIDKHTLETCPACGNTEVSYATRIIGYLKRIESFSKARRAEHDLRYYHTIKRGSK